jgi:hypothetical protein
MNTGHLMTPVYEIAADGAATGASAAIVHHVTFADFGLLAREVAVLTPVGGQSLPQAVRKWTGNDMLVDVLPAVVLTPEAYASYVGGTQAIIASRAGA